jgi:hypothetical protein
MSLYPETIARCQHLRVNGTQCGSPALRKQRFCFFHKDWRQKRLQINTNLRREQGIVILPVLEDANSIQVALMQVMRLLISAQIDHRTAGLLLYALQTASANLARTTFEPELPTQVVIDRDVVSRRPLGATAWSADKDREYDDQDEDKKDTENESLARILLDRMGLPHKLRQENDEEDDLEDDNEEDNEEDNEDENEGEESDDLEPDHLGSENAT